jgi:predicted phosphodiesterase
MGPGTAGSALSPADIFARAALDPEQRLALHNLPPRIELADDILAVHGTPDDDNACLLEETTEDGRYVPARREVLAARLGDAAKAQVVLCGHSHRQAITLGPMGCLILNPGSVGCPVFADIPIASVLEHSSPHARYGMLTKRNGRWGAELFALEYDWITAARRADENGRPEWAMALATGAVG